MGLEAGTVAAWAAAASAATGIYNAANQPKPSTPQESKKPDAGMSAKDRRNKLLAQLAAGAARNNPSGGTAGNANIAQTLLGS